MDILLACAEYLCGQCFSLVGSGFRSCYNQATPYLCFQTALGGSGGGQTPVVTASLPAVTDPQQITCQTAGDIILSCEAATSGFESLDDSVADSGLCYSNSLWQPQSFDQPWSSCISWASTADTSDFAGWNSFRGFCSSVGDVMSAASAAATTTPAATNMVTTAETGTAHVTQISTGSTATSPATAAKSGATISRPREIFFEVLMPFVISIMAGAFIF